MVPISHQNRFESFVRVEICGRRAINRHRSKQAIAVLQRVVAVVPATAVLHSSELVGEAVSRCNGALGDAIDAIHVRRQILPDAVEVD